MTAFLPPPSAWRRLAAVALVSAPLLMRGLSPDTWTPGPGWALTWSDEFSGTTVNPANWTYDLGAGGWGNGELETYTTTNASVQNGVLSVSAVKNPDGSYTSARLKTQGRLSWTYGKIAARMRLPKGQGMWPAFWLLGDNIGTVGWPACGEIDIMEMIGGGAGRDDTFYSTLHWSANGGHASTGVQKSLPSPQIFNDDYHVFEAEWTPTDMIFRLDGVECGRRSVDTALWPTMTAFHANFFIILNLAVGGYWPGYPDATTAFPQTLTVDWVRVYTSAAPTYATWATTQFFPAGRAGMLDDADGDGLSNLLEYALGTDPNQNSPTQAPQAGASVTVNGADYPTLGFTRNLNAPDLTLSVQVSDTLAFGTDLGSTLVSATALGHGTELDTYRSNTSYAQAPRQFLRLRVNAP